MQVQLKVKPQIQLLLQVPLQILLHIHLQLTLQLQLREFGVSHANPNSSHPTLIHGGL